MGGCDMKKEENILIRNLSELIKVKTLVTLIVIMVFAFLSLRGRIGEEQVMYVVTSVIAFYFGTQHESRKNDTKRGE